MPGGVVLSSFDEPFQQFGRCPLEIGSLNGAS